jgi:hypothetical protein
VNELGKKKNVNEDGGIKMKEKRKKVESDDSRRGVVSPDAA